MTRDIDAHEQIRPTKIRLEASTYCQLRCPTCPTTTGETHAGIGGGFLKFEDFRTLLDGSPWLEEIELSNYGEMAVLWFDTGGNDLIEADAQGARVRELQPMARQEFDFTVEHAHDRGVRLTARTGVNLNNATDAMLEAVVKYRFEHLRCSLDGASNETYRQYRIRGNFDRVIANIRKINGYKAEYGSDRPGLTWQFVVFGHNEHEIARAREMAEELGMEFLSFAGKVEGSVCCCRAPSLSVVRWRAKTGRHGARYRSV